MSLVLFVRAVGHYFKNYFIDFTFMVTLSHIDKICTAEFVK